MAFNVQNRTQLSALVIACEKTGLPAIAQMSSRYVAHEARRGGLEEYLRMAGRQNLYLHLDHCTDDLLIHHCIRLGFDSVMFDGSRLTMEENVARTNRVAAWAHAAGCLVEAELGRIAGVEDGMGSEDADLFNEKEFGAFCSRVKADLVAPAIGNAHGFYSDSNQVRLDLLPLAQRQLQPGQFLVLHGGTGLSEAALLQAARNGAVKLNISTHLKQRTRELAAQALSQMPLFDEIAMDAKLTEGLAGFYAGYMSSLAK